MITNRRLTIAAILMFVIFYSSFQMATVNDCSMENTLKNGDYVLASKLAYRFDDCNRGDIVIFNRTESFKKYVKRIIAIEGDTVTFKNNDVYVNGKRIKEEYIGSKTNSDVKKYEVPKNKVFVMGDNRKVSIDSRKFGCVEVDNIESKVIVKLFPLRKIKIF